LTLSIAGVTVSAMFVSQLYQGVCARDVATVLAAWMNATPKPLTALLEDLTKTPVQLQVLASGERALTSREQFRLGAEGLAACHWRHGLLIADGEVAASTSLLWLPARLPAEVCRELDAGDEPAGKILGPLGMKRTDRRAMATTSIEEVTGQDAAVMSSAVLTVGKVAVGIAEETITRAFAAALTGGTAL
jgi:chorismate-pyruvate lyase